MVGSCGGYWYHRPDLACGGGGDVKRQQERLVRMLDDIERLRAVLVAQRFDAVESHGGSRGRIAKVLLTRRAYQQTCRAVAALYEFSPQEEGESAETANQNGRR